jgi:hypothetical protein
MKKFFRWTDKQLALIPEQVKPTGNEWKHVRRSIWRRIWELIVGWEIDENEFEPGSLHEMEHWRAPRCPKGQEIGDMLQDKKYHIHHKKPKHMWGTNKKDNLVIVSPRYHDEWIIDPEYHYKWRPSKRK